MQALSLTLPCDLAPCLEAHNAELLTLCTTETWTGLSTHAKLGLHGHPVPGGWCCALGNPCSSALDSAAHINKLTIVAVPETGSPHL